MAVLTTGDDVFVGGDLAETITALAGNDSLVMGGGDDTVFGSTDMAPYSATTATTGYSARPMPT